MECTLKKGKKERNYMLERITKGETKVRKKMESDEVPLSRGRHGLFRAATGLA
jgi:hypothetical protein